MTWCRPAATAAALAALLGAVSACTDATPEADPPRPSSPSAPVPGERYCAAVVEASGLDDVRVDQLGQEEGADGVDCVFTSAGTVADLSVRVGELAVDQYETTVAGRDDSSSGFADATVSEPTGWWSQARRWEAVQIGSARRFDVVLDDDFYARLQVVGPLPASPGAAGQDERDAETRRVADALLTAVGDLR